MSRRPQRLLRLGIPLGPLLLLRTRGRRSGAWRTVPVAPLRFQDRRYLVAPFGDTAWVHNARAHGHAELGRGRDLQPVTLVEVVGAERTAVLSRYRRTYALVPFVRRAFAARPAQGTAAFAAEADQHPVFVVTPLDPTT